MTTETTVPDYSEHMDEAEKRILERTIEDIPFLLRTYQDEPEYIRDVLESRLRLFYHLGFAEGQDQGKVKERSRHAP